MKIVRFEAENVKRLRAVSISPEGNVVKIAGQNGQGKTSVLDAIWYCLGGAKAFPAEPVRRGEKHGRVLVEIAGKHSLVVERTWDAKTRRSTIEVRDADGVPQRSPQELLNSLVGQLSFDPLAFTRWDPKKQAETLRQLAGLDLQPIEERRARLYDERTTAHRKLDELKAQWEGAPAAEPGTPEAEESLTELFARQRDRDATQANAQRERDGILRDQAAKRQEAKRAADRAREMAERITALEGEVRALEAQLAAKRDVLDEARASQELQQDRADELGGAAMALLAPPEIPTADAALDGEVKAAEERNRQVRIGRRKRELKVSFDAAKRTWGDLEAAVVKCDADKAEAIAAARFPVPGLGFGTEEGVTLNALPLEQASGAEQLRVSVAMGLALNPKLPVLLIRDGSLLDANSLRILGEMATTADAQVWLEVVGKPEDAAVIIEDGTASGPQAEAIAGAGDA